MIDPQTPLPPPGSRVIVGLSGGVDSSVSALLLKQQGYQITAVFMKNWEEDDSDDYCSTAEDVADAQAVCDKLGIELLTINFAAEYWDNVFAHFLSEYQAGRTPNPDILCNKEIKFKAFLDYATQLNVSHIATGHYAQITHTSSGYQLRKGADLSKDQSYFLYTLGQAQLARSIFPVGHLPKTEVRRLAEKAGLITHSKKDSTGICFIGERKFKQFLQRYLPAQPGEMINEHQQVIGQHDGLMYYTIGQRQGLQVGGRKESSGEPWYVADKDLTHNRLLIVQGSEHPLLFKNTLHASQLHWVAGHPPAAEFTCTAKTRYRQSDQPCRITLLGSDSLQVDFDTPQRAITPGQALVLYQGDVCLGGGTIGSGGSSQ